MEKQQTPARATRSDVAARAGVSVAVVSYVLNDGPRPVAAATRDRVLQAMDELNYRPNAMARALKLSRSNVLGLLLPDIANPFFAEFARDVQTSAHRAGAAVMIANTGLDPQLEAAQVRSILDREVDGLISFGIRDESALKRVLASGVPLVSMDWQLQHESVATITSDDFGATRDGVSHLLSHGITDIAFIGGPGDLIVSQTRRQAWLDTLTSQGATPADMSSRAVEAPFSLEGGYEAGRRLLQSGRPQGVFASSDVQAIGLLRAAAELGLSVPGDLRVISVDGSAASAYTTPGLTVIQLPIREMAERAVQRLTESSHAPELHTTAPHRLVLRGSCGFH